MCLGGGKFCGFLFASLGNETLIKKIKKGAKGESLEILHFFH